MASISRGGGAPGPRELRAWGSCAPLARVGARLALAAADQARADFGHASWYGVSRRMEVLNAPPAGIGREQSTLAKGIAYGGISGPIPVVSLHVLVFARDGRRVFGGRGGIDFLHEVDLTEGNPQSLRHALRPNAAIFQDPAFLREAVVRAFDPFLTPTSAPSTSATAR